MPGSSQAYPTISTKPPDRPPRAPSRVASSQTSPSTSPPSPAVSWPSSATAVPTLQVPVMSPIDLGTDIPYLQELDKPTTLRRSPRPSLGSAAAAMPFPSLMQATASSTESGNGTPASSIHTLDSTMATAGDGSSPHLRSVRSTPHLGSDVSHTSSEVALHRARSRVQTHSRALHRALDDERPVSPIARGSMDEYGRYTPTVSSSGHTMWSDHATEHATTSKTWALSRERRAAAAAAAAAPSTSGLGLVLHAGSSTDSVPLEYDSSPSGSTHASPHQTLRRRLSMTWGAGHRARSISQGRSRPTSPPPVVSPLVLPTLTEPSLPDKLQPRHSTTNLRRLFRAGGRPTSPEETEPSPPTSHTLWHRARRRVPSGGTKSDTPTSPSMEGTSAGAAGAAAPPATPSKSPRLASFFRDLPEMPNPYAALTQATSSVFSSSEQQQQRNERQRKHLLNELAETERIYAADLGVVKNVYLAQARLRAGLRTPTPSSTASFSSWQHPSPEAPPRSLSSLSSEPDTEHGVLYGTADSKTRLALSASDVADVRTAFQQLHPPSAPLSGGSVSSSSSAAPTPAPPLSVTDIYVIFAGVETCAALAQEMTAQFAACARGERSIAEVFVDKMGVLEQAFSLYCSRHEAAIARLTYVTTHHPAAAAFLRDCDEASRQHSHAWDLSSLLIKPVQRVLKYPLFLRSILEHTDKHEREYTQLQQALEQMQGVADRINESKKRMDMVGQHGFGLPAPPKQTFRRTGAAQALRRQKTAQVDGPLTDDEAQYVALTTQMTEAEHAIHRFAQHCTVWMRSVRAMYESQLAFVHEWIAVYECGPMHDDGAARDRLVQFHTRLQRRILGDVCGQLEASLDRAVHAPVRAMLALLDRPRMVMLNRAAKEADYRRYLHDRAKRPNTKQSAEAMAFLSMHKQLIEEIPVLLRGLSFILQRCMFQLARLQTAYHGVVADILRSFCVQYMPSAMTPTSTSSVSSPHMPAMLATSPDVSMASVSAPTSSGLAMWMPETVVPEVPPIALSPAQPASHHERSTTPIVTVADVEGPAPPPLSHTDEPRTPSTGSTLAPPLPPITALYTAAPATPPKPTRSEKTKGEGRPRLSTQDRPPAAAPLPSPSAHTPLAYTRTRTIDETPSQSTPLAVAPKHPPYSPDTPVAKPRSQRPVSMMISATTLPDARYSLPPLDVSVDGFAQSLMSRYDVSGLGGADTSAAFGGNESLFFDARSQLHADTSGLPPRSNGVL